MKKENNIFDNKILLLIFIGLSILFLFTIILLIINFSSSDEIINNQNEGITTRNDFQISDCPFECCVNSKYSEKLCNVDYECRNYSCIEKDSDGDGLSDIIEKQIGTNPQVYDTDGDTLSDYKEYTELKTNPLSKNTDNDRYNDNEDPNSTVVNTADIKGKYNWNTNINLINLGLAFITGGTSALLNPDLEIAKINVDINLSNVGNDYTSYVEFDLIYLINGVQIEKSHIKLDRLNAGYIKSVGYEKSIKVGNIPDILIQSISKTGKDSKMYVVKIENVNYEKYN